MRIALGLALTWVISLTGGAKVVPLDGIVLAQTALILDSGMLREGIVDESVPVCQPPSRGWRLGGPSEVSYPCTEKVVGEQIAPRSCP